MSWVHYGRGKVLELVKGPNARGTPSEAGRFSQPSDLAAHRNLRVAHPRFLRVGSAPLNPNTLRLRSICAKLFQHSNHRPIDRRPTPQCASAITSSAAPLYFSSQPYPPFPKPPPPLLPPNRNPPPAPLRE